VVPTLWGGVFLAGGVAVWMAVPRVDHPVATAWRASEASPGRELRSEIRAGAGEPALLKLEWPAYPEAQGYRLRFRDAEGRTLPPVTVESTVFLYDLGSDVLDLPSSFEWEVAAVLRDGSEVVAPPRVHPVP